MILLRPMRDDEYLAYLDYFIPDYTAEITANYALLRQMLLLRRSAKSQQIYLMA